MKKIIMTRISRKQLIIATTIFLVAFALLSCTSNNWPQFRGPDNNMIATGKNLPTEWGDDLNVRWTYEVNGDSWSQVVKRYVDMIRRQVRFTGNYMWQDTTISHPL